MIATVACRFLNRSISCPSRPGAPTATAPEAMTAGPFDLMRPFGGRARPGCSFAALLFVTLSLLLVTAALLGPLFLVVMDHALADTALLKSAHHVLQPLVDGRIVDDPPERALAGIDLLQNRFRMTRDVIDLLEEGVGVRLVVHQPPDQPPTLVNALRGPAHRGGHRPEVLHGLGALAFRRGELADEPLVAVGLFGDRSQIAESG